ncbi:MAG: MATE family efflux transporter [Kiritimatiellia bacterium]
MSLNLLETPVRHLFGKYLVPTVCATLVTAIYLFADTVMIGHRLGASGVAALNLIIPMEFFFFAVGSLFGNGGAILFTQYESRGNHVEARKVFTTAATTVCVLSLAMMLTTVFGLRFVASTLLGAEASLLDDTLHYGQWIAWGCPAFVAVTFLQPFLRHDHAPRLAMIGVLAGGGTNIVLDWIFIYPMDWGLSGAGLATLIGAFVAMAVMLLHFYSPIHRLRLSRPLIRLLPTLIRFGGGSFLQELSGCVTVLLLNHIVLGALGETGLVLYGVLTNYLLVLAALFNGIAHAAQPIIAANMAVGYARRVKQTLQLALGSAGGVGIGAMAVALCFPLLLLNAFLPVEAIDTDRAITAIRIGALAFPFVGIGQCVTLSLPALGRPNRGTILAFARSGALLIPLALLLPLWRAEALWWAFVLAEVAIMPFVFWSLSARKQS